MKIKILSLGQLKTNCYILYNDSECIIVDAGDEATFIAEEAERLKVKPQMIIATHGHFDHNLAAGELQLIYNIPYFIHKDDVFLIKNLSQSAQHWLKTNTDIIQPQQITLLENGKVINLGDEYLKTLSTPGHTPGSICLKANNFILTGDTLFKNDIGRYDFSYSSKEKILSSLNLLMELPDNLIVYPGHGDSTTIGDEKKD